MNYFSIAQSFVEQCERGAPIDELAAAFQCAVQALGFRYFACCSHVDPLNPPRRAVIVHTYPAQWMRKFSEVDWYYIDPVFRFADRTLLPFFWDAPPFRADLTAPQEALLAEAARFGIVHGYTIPIHSPYAAGGFRASCSVIPDSAQLDARSYAAVQLMACPLYEAAGRNADAKDAKPEQPGLSRRERQCLELAAQGKSDWVVGKILGISERTVHNHIENAKRRLGVVTRVQAIVHSLASHEISFGDVIRSVPDNPHGAITLRTGPVTGMEVPVNQTRTAPRRLIRSA